MLYALFLLYLYELNVIYLKQKILAPSFYELSYDVLMLRIAYLNGSYKIWTNVDQSNFIWWPQGKRKYWDRLHNWIASIRILNTRLQVIHYWLLLFRMVTKGWITTNMNQVTTDLTMPRLTLFFYHCVSDFIF